MQIINQLKTKNLIFWYYVFLFHSKFEICQFKPKLKTNHRIIFLTSNERFKASLTLLECFFVSRRSVRLKLKLFYENFFVDSLFVLLVNITYFVDQNTNSQHGIWKTLWPHASGISAMLSIEAFSLGNELVHVQTVPGSSIDSPVVTPRHDNVK